MDVALVVARVGLAFMLAVAAIAKITDREGFRASLGDFRVPRRLVVPVGAAVPAAELVVAAGLLVQPTAAWAAAASAALLTAFAVAQASVVVHGDEAECRCFGRLTDGPVDRGSVLRTAALAAVATAVAVLGWNDPGTSPLRWVGDLSTTEAVLAGAVVVLAVVALGQGAFSCGSSCASRDACGAASTSSRARSGSSARSAATPSTPPRGRRRPAGAAPAGGRSRG
jgi:Methylamine utilisation protein MauE